MAVILIVDDDRLILATLGKGLRSSGYEVMEASSGQDALHLCQQTSPDLALLDGRMPGMTGLELARELFKEGIPFMFLSAYGDEEVVAEAVKYGAFSYLVKPIDVPQIIPVIEAALRRSAEMAELKCSERDLSVALTKTRQTSTAVGVIMERYRLSENEAFEALRTYSRSQRRRLKDVATDLVQSTSTINVSLDAIKKPLK